MTSKGKVEANLFTKSNDVGTAPDTGKKTNCGGFRKGVDVRGRKKKLRDAGSSRGQV